MSIRNCYAEIFTAVLSVLILSNVLFSFINVEFVDFIPIFLIVHAVILQAKKF